MTVENSLNPPTTDIFDRLWPGLAEADAADNFDDNLGNELQLRTAPSARRGNPDDRPLPPVDEEDRDDLR